MKTTLGSPRRGTNRTSGLGCVLAMVGLATMTLVACGKKDDAPSTSTTTSKGNDIAITKQANTNANDPKPAAKSATPGFTGSCDYRGKESWCGEYMTAVLDKDGVDSDLQKSMCEASKGTWSTEKCAAEKKLGACTDDEGYIRVYYSSGGTPFTAATAKEICGSGKWEVAK